MLGHRFSKFLPDDKSQDPFERLFGIFMQLLNYTSGDVQQVENPKQSAGRSLGFISQEIGREINTLGAKAYDADIQKLVVQMKDELEKIKEQLANVL